MPHLAQIAIQGDQNSENLLRQYPSFLDLFKDALVNQIEKLRHHGEGCDVALAQRPQ